jgi:acetamidase/formamidase
VYYPVHVPGAKFSGGDLHFSQGDGEITFCGAIEIGGFIDFGVDLIKDCMSRYGVLDNPVFIPGRVEPSTPQPSRCRPGEGASERISSSPLSGSALGSAPTTCS